MNDTTVTGPAGATAYQPRTPWPPLAAFLAAVGAVLLAFAVAGAMAFSGLGLGFDLPTVLIVSTIGQQAVLIGAAIWLAGQRGGRPAEVLTLGPPRAGARAYLLGLVTVFGCVAVMTGAIHAIDPELIKADLRQFNVILQAPIWWAIFPMVGIGAPLAEELLFRGFLFSAIAASRAGVTGAALITSAGWAAVHSYSLIGVLQVFVIGLVFSWMLVRTGSLRVPIAVHAIYNSALAALMITEAGGGGLTR